jgi:hypothetical protein
MDEQPAVDALGEAVIAGCPVMPNGYALRVGVHVAGPVAGGSVGGGVGAAAGAAISQDASDRMSKPVSPGDHEGWMYLVAGEQQVAVFEYKRGLLRSKLGALLVQFARADVSGCEWTPSGMGASDLTISLADGTSYPLQVARVQRAKGEAVYAHLTS